MKVQIVRIADRGIPNRERLHLSVLADTDLSSYVILKSFLAMPDFRKVFSGAAPAWWFPPTPVKAGDQVILYTCKGNNSVQREPSGRATYFFFWGFDQTLWNAPTDCALVVEASAWISSSFGT